MMLVNSFGLLLGLIAVSLPVAAVLAILAFAMGWIYSPMPLYLAIADIAWTNSTEFILLAIPLFVFMGELLLRSGIANRMYEALTHWVGWLPGGLMHSNIAASALFATTSGSSVATAATIGTVAIPEMGKRGYNAPLFLGSIASGGTLGILIPPSTNMIIYGVLTNTSVPKLYLAGLIPGFLLAALFMLTVLVLCLFRPSWGGMVPESSWGERLRRLNDLLPPIGIFFVAVGSIYLGLATPTEAAALGVLAVLVLAACSGTLTIPMLRAAAQGTMRTTGMLMIIILAAMFLNFVLGIIGLTQTLTRFVGSLGLSPLEMMIAIVIFYLILGCFMESLSMLITTAGLVTPIVVGLGYDAVWFGIMLMVLLEMALVTPPIGMNLYVVHGVRGKGDIRDIIYGVMPFLAAMLALVALLIATPELATWLPSVVN